MTGLLPRVARRITAGRARLRLRAPGSLKRVLASGCARARVPRPKRALILSAVLGLATLGCWLCLQPLPEALRDRQQEPSVRVLDRNGRLIREVHASDGALCSRVTLSDVSKYVEPALLAAEDARFRRHWGFDPVAIARALGQALWHRRVVSGASTLTQQLARNVRPHRRTLWGKLEEIGTALAIERALDKDEILEQYLNRIEFGPNLRGIEAASRAFLDKPCKQLSLAEAALLVAIPRGPALYDPRRGTERVKRRRDRILERMRQRGMLSDAAIDEALAEPVKLQPVSASGGAFHFVRALQQGKVASGFSLGSATEVQTTLDLELQREVEVLVARTVSRLRAVDASAAAALVIDNATSDVLAYVGSPDFSSIAGLGQNDGVLALRQPGSALKPFVYALGLEDGMTPATLLPDIELSIRTANGESFSPHNYDGRYHGPVRLREALANSLNVPAVYLAQRLGPQRVLERLRRVGFESLSGSADQYGAALALGDGEVRLSELALAYSTLARGGEARVLRTLTNARLASGERRAFDRAPAARVIGADAARQITGILADDAARAASFGRNGVLAFGFPVAAKTGTSKGFRDNWAVGYTRQRTVAVWVGNFDGHPMHGSSGVTGAGPLFHAILEVAMRGLEPEPLLDDSMNPEIEICALSGLLAGPDCPHRIRERFRPNAMPTQACSMHVRVQIDPETSLLAGSACRASTTRVVESYPAQYASWADGARRPIAPLQFSPNCPGVLTNVERGPEILYPPPGSIFWLDPALAAREQQIVLAARSERALGLRFIMDGRVLSPPRDRKLVWSLERGVHEFRVQDDSGHASTPVAFEVH